MLSSTRFLRLIFNFYFNFKIFIVTFIIITNHLFQPPFFSFPFPLLSLFSGIEDLPNDPAPILSGFETLTSDKVMLICIRIVMVWAILAGFCTFVFFASQVSLSLSLST